MRGRVAPSTKTQRTIERTLTKTYNKDSTLENIKIKEKDMNLSKRIKSGEISTTIENGKQGKHIKSHENYIPGRSYLTISEKEAQDIVNKYAGTGYLQRDKKDLWKHKEIVEANKPIGMNVDPITGEEVETRRFVIHYSKKGVHIVPTRP